MYCIGLLAVIVLFCLWQDNRLQSGKSGKRNRGMGGVGGYIRIITIMTKVVKLNGRSLMTRCSNMLVVNFISYNSRARYPCERQNYMHIVHKRRGRRQWPF